MKSNAAKNPSTFATFVDFIDEFEFFGSPAGVAKNLFDYNYLQKILPQALRACSSC
jgi:hypothetical protein